MRTPRRDRVGPSPACRVARDPRIVLCGLFASPVGYPGDFQAPGERWANARGRWPNVRTESGFQPPRVGVRRTTMIRPSSAIPFRYKQWVDPKLKIPRVIRLLNITALKYLCIHHGDQRGFFNLKSSKMSYFSLSASFEYLCYGVYGLYKYVYSGNFRRKKSIPAL